MNELVEVLASERDICRRAQRFWRIVSIVAAIALGLIGWPWGLLAFGFFQFIAYATHWHSVRLMEQATGLTEAQQAAVLTGIDTRK